jgi:hypothetical protein
VDDLGDVGQRCDDVSDLFSAEPFGAGSALPQARLGKGLLALGLGDPLADDLGVAAGVEGGAVGGELAVAPGDDSAVGPGVGGGVGLGVDDLVEGCAIPLRCRLR